MSNKMQFAQWFQKTAYTLQHGLERGAAKTIEIRNAVNEKIESNPRTKAARDKANAFIKDKAERIADVEIAGKRIGNFPLYAQHLAERQLYKMIAKMREVDPDMHWDQFIPNPDELPIFEAFERLGLPYGTPFDEIKKQYRRLMRQYHPDKHTQSPEAEKIATQKTQELTIAYELICQHYGK